MAMNDASGGIWLTAGGFKALQKELEHLTLVKRPEIADRIRASQEHGEFSEDNNELDEVKFEQAIVESRVAELKTIFGTAQILDTNMIPTEHVGMGSVATLEDKEFGETFQVRVVSTIEADPNKELISNESPMGQALWGAAAGEIISFVAPDGKRSYSLLSISK